MNALERIWRDISLFPIRHFRRIEGWLTKNEALALYRLAKQLPPGAQVIEIGSWKGRSTFCIAKGLKSGRIIAIDPFDASGEAGSRELYHGEKGNLPLLEQFKHNLRQQGLLHKIEIKQGYSKDFASTIGDADFVFIDGDHSQEGCDADFRLFSGKVKRGGVLGLHDFDERRPELGPTWVVEHRLRGSPAWSLVGQWNSLILFRRTECPRPSANHGPAQHHLPHTNPQ